VMGGSIRWAGGGCQQKRWTESALRILRDGRYAASPLERRTGDSPCLTGGKVKATLCQVTLLRTVRRRARRGNELDGFSGSDPSRGGFPPIGVRFHDVPVRHRRHTQSPSHTPHCADRSRFLFGSRLPEGRRSAHRILRPEVDRPMP